MYQLVADAESETSTVIGTSNESSEDVLQILLLDTTTCIFY